MKKLLLFLTLSFLTLSCKTQEEVKLEGDLYYNWLKLGSFYGRPDSLYQHYLEGKEKGSLENAQVELLEKHDLIKSPFIYLKMDTDTIFTIYFTSEDYVPITKYTYQNLVDSKQKVRLKLLTEMLSEKLYLCKKIISPQVVDGETLQQERKFKIEEYR